MKVHVVRVSLGAALALGGGWGGALAETYRCHQGDGAIVFQESPCPLTELTAPETGRPVPPQVQPVRPEASPVRQAPPPAPRNAVENTATPDKAPGPRVATAPASEDEVESRPTKRKRDVLEQSAQFERCRADAPGFAEKSAVVYAAWTRRHAATLAEFDKVLAARVRAARRGEASLPLRLCTDEWLRGIEPLSRTPDVRFQTVEKTWQVFIGALMTGDRATALNCLASRAESRWKERVEKMSDEDLRRIAATIRAMKVQWGDDYEKEALVLDTENRAVGIAFRNVNEEWKIVDWGGATAPQPAAPATERRSSPGS